MAPDRTALERWHHITLKCFPWLARIGLAASGALKIASAAGRTEIEGGGPAAARVGDSVGYLYAQTSAGTLLAIYYSPTPPPAGAWVPVVTAPVPPSPTTNGTPIAIVTGSGKVKVG